MGGLRETVARLAAGSRGRTEADIQSDVRAFLLDAPLDLVDEQVVDVALEAQAGGGRRIDVEAGCAAIEVKKSLGSKTVFEDAVVQLARYVKQRTEERAQRYVGVLTDGQVWVLFHLEPRGDLAEVSRLRLRGGEDASRLAAWLEPVLATTERIRPTPKEIVRRLGAESTATQLDLADLRSLYETCRAHPEVQLKRELWARLLLSALGTNFEDSDELFVTHTYLVLAAELIAHEVMDIPVDAPDGDFRALLEGQRFAIHGIHGVVEADFFDWPATVSAGQPIIAGIARRLASFDWSDVNHDVLKALYTSVIDVHTRRKLGEYYTPDWLAQKMVDEHFSDPLKQRLLDPACGSGTFLFWAIRRFLAACDQAAIPNREALAQVVDRVQGIDLHPVAVTLARVTYLLALTPERLADREELTVPVFLGDSVRWEQDDTVRTDAGITVPTSDPVEELLEDSLHFPEGVLEEPQRFDRLVKALADKAAHSKPNAKVPGIKGILNRHKVSGDEDRAAIEVAFTKLCRLRWARRDHVWSYYIRNLARPLSFTRTEGQADVLVGNPPWLAYRSMPQNLQETYRVLAGERGLWAGGMVATHQDLSDLFVARSVEQYLKPDGSFAFVMPYAVLSRGQFAGFRSGDWSCRDVKVFAALGTPEEFARVKPPLFQVPSCVVTGTKAAAPAELSSDVTVWTGRVSNHNLDWAAAAKQLEAAEARIEPGVNSGSPYRARFRQGAVLVPRVLVTVEETPSGRIGVTAGRVRVRSARSSNEKRPWKDLGALEGVIEREFVKPMHLGATIVAYRARTPALAVVPYIDGKLIDGTNERLDEFPGLAGWWRDAEHLWEEHKTEATRLTLLEQIDYQSKLRKQFPIAPHRVVYTKSGQHLAACRIEDPEAVIDHKLYWASVESVDEGRYLCAVLNSQVLADAVVGLQARGQHNPRDFDMHVFALAFPEFDPLNDAHRRLVRLADHAEHVASSVPLTAGGQFQKARRATREALRADGVAHEIDLVVDEVVADAGVPDLMAVMAEAEEAAQGPRRRGKRQARASELAAKSAR